jgi:hypothetical protein
MFRFAPGWALRGPLFDGTDGGGGGGGNGGGGGEKDAAYWQGEAKKAFEVRDTAKAALKTLQESGAVLSDEDKKLFEKLKKDAADADEAAKRKAGEFDALKQQLVDKHATELETRDGKIATLGRRFQDTVVRAEFGTATDLFGGHAESKTVLDVDMAIAVLGKYVSAVDDEKDARGYRIVVKNAHGNEIVDGKGNPVPFATAIAEVISTLPNKDRILRGSGKAGSGSTGGGPTHGQETDLEVLTQKAARGDADAIKALRTRRSGSGIEQGRAWNQVPAKT